jgi:uncharacterized protein YraI
MPMQRMLGAAAVLTLSTGLAAAAPAAVETDANVRTGPGTGYRVIATLPAGTVVDAGPCTSWCRIRWSGGEGYMARSLLALGAAPPAVAVGPTYYDDYYDDYPFFGYAYGPSIGFVHRHRWRHHRPGWGHDRPGRPGAGRPPVGGTPGGGGAKIGQSVRPGGFPSGGGTAIGGGAKAGASFGGGGGAAVSAPAASAPAASAPAAAAGAGGKFR